MATGGRINTDILSDETFDVLCTTCKTKGKNTECVKFCVDCKYYFCIQCVQVHNQVPVCAGHKMLDKSLVTSRISKGLQRAPTERCDRHSHKHIDMYCQNHDNVGCSTCMAVDHRACQDICYIPEFIRNNTYQTASTEIQTKLKQISKTLAEQVTKFKQDKQWLLKRKAELLADINKFRHEINDQLDKLEKNSIDEVEFKVKHLEDKIEDSLKRLQANNARVTSANDKLASPNTNQAEVFVHVKIGEDAANVAHKCIEDNKSKSTGDDIEFQSEKTILSLLQQNKALGTLKEIPSKTKTPDALFQIKEKHSSYESQSYFNSACCLKDGAIVLADYINKRLKRVHYNNYTVTDYCDLPGAPWQVCSINTTQVAVTLPLQKEVHFISVEGQMSTTNKIKTDFECYGLAYKNNNLYVSDSGTDIYIYTLSGKKLKQLRIFLRKTQSFISHLKDSLTFYQQYITSLAVSKDATRIYVADRKRGLIVLDNDGKVITNYDGENLYNATCCYVTEAGSVLVSGYFSKNVLQFTSDGELLGEVMKTDSDKGAIVSVCCNEQMSKMYVCRFGKYNIKVYRKNNIEVYDI